MKPIIWYILTYSEDSLIRSVILTKALSDLLIFMDRKYQNFK